MLEVNYSKILDRNIFKDMRVRTEDSMNAFRKNLLTQNCHKILEETDVDTACDIFLKILKSLFDRHCLIIKHSRKQQNRKSLCMTKGYKMPAKRKIHYIDN